MNGNKWYYSSPKSDCSMRKPRKSYFFLVFITLYVTLVIGSVIVFWDVIRNIL